MSIHRIDIDPVNTRYELNSAVYLGLKEEFDKMDKGYTWVDNENKVKMFIEKNRNMKRIKLTIIQRQ